MSDKKNKDTNKAGAIGYQEDQGQSVGPVGPTFLVTMPEGSTEGEMEEMRDLFLIAPESHVGCVIVTRDGITAQRLSD